MKVITVKRAALCTRGRAALCRGRLETWHGPPRTQTSRFLPVFVERSSGKNRIILSSVDGARSQDGARCGVSFSGAAGTREPFAFQVPVRLSGAGISLA